MTLATRLPTTLPNRLPTMLSDPQGVELSQLELAYAITVHKAQGGEAAHVVLALSREHGRMLTRRLLYTGTAWGVGWRGRGVGPQCCQVCLQGMKAGVPKALHTHARLSHTPPQA